MKVFSRVKLGWLPRALERAGIRGLLRQRIADLGREGSEDDLIAKLLRSPIALETDTANEQHYELPPEFFEIVLGPFLKYSSAYWMASQSWVQRKNACWSSRASEQNSWTVATYSN